METQVSQEEKHQYLMDWYWVAEDHPAGFKVYSHGRFPNIKYKLDKAYEVMKANEPSVEPILTARLDNPEEMAKIKEFTQMIIDPEEYQKKKAVEGLAKFMGADYESVRRAIDRPTH